MPDQLESNPKHAVGRALQHIAAQVDSVEDNVADIARSMKSMADSFERVANVAMAAHAEATVSRSRLLEFANETGALVKDTRRLVNKVEEELFIVIGRVSRLEESVYPPLTNGYAPDVE